MQRHIKFILELVLLVIWAAFAGQSAIAQSAQIAILNTIGTVGPGQTININCSVENTGGSTDSFVAAAEFDSAVTNQAGQLATTNIGPGASTVVSFVCQLPWNWTNGTYDAHVVVRSSPPAKTWLNDTDQDFIVSVPALTVSGRLAYEEYSNYLAAPVNSDDGNIFIYPLPNGPRVNVTANLPIENAMNPHFSPDGSKIVFMAIPTNASRAYDSLEIFVYDLASATLSRLTTNCTPDEDPNFSPDGQSIIYKGDKQIWVMGIDGSNPQARTTTSDEKSGPNFSPDGTRIVYWSGASNNADIWWMGSNGFGASPLIATTNLAEYYPVYWNGTNILYARSESLTSPYDKIYSFSTTSNTAQPLLTDLIGSDDSDPFPVNQTIIGFSSDRAGASGYDLYFGDTTSGVIYQLPNLNTSIGELGGAYSPYSHAREVTLLSPTNGSVLVAGSTIVVKVRAWSDGGIWSGAYPMIVFEGFGTNSFPGLHDDGMNGDQTNGDGIYSTTITLPPVAGSNSVFVSAASLDGGMTNRINSASIGITLTPGASIYGFAWSTNGSFNLNCVSPPGSTNVLFSSTNLVSWQAVSTNIAGSTGIFEFTDPNNHGIKARFYRLVKL